jgi:hypothetical protein
MALINMGKVITKISLSCISKPDEAISHHSDFKTTLLSVLKIKHHVQRNYFDGYKSL